MFLIAGSTGEPEVLKILARHSKFPEAAKNAADQTIFAVAAAACGLGDLLTRCISLGWDVNQVIMDGTDVSALGWAAAHGHLDIVCMLLSHGAHPDGKQGFDNSVANPAHPLLGAVKRGDEEIVSLLLENGSNVNVRDDNSEILFYAITNPRIFRMLLEKGAMPNGFKDAPLRISRDVQ
jgi:ankyrin repeat protein